MDKGGVSTSARRRSTLLGVLIFAAFGLLMLRILLIQTVDFEKYQNKVINQMTRNLPFLRTEERYLTETATYLRRT